jgi:hypothetical protein
VGFLRLQNALGLHQDAVQGLIADLVLELVQHLDESAHVRAALGVGEVHGKAHARDGFLLHAALVLHRDGVADVPDPHLLDGHVPVVGPVLDVNHLR